MNLGAGSVRLLFALVGAFGAYLMPLPLSAQSFVTGPEVVGVSPVKGARITVELDSPATAEVRHWAINEMPESNKKVNGQGKEHEFFVPLDQERKYLVVLLDSNGQEIKRSSLYSTKAAIQIPRDIARITILDPTVVNGNQLRVKVDALNVSSITVSWRHQGQDKLVTQPLSNGHQELIVELPAPPINQTSLLVPVIITAQNGETLKKDVLTERPPSTTPPQIGEIDVRKSYRSAIFSIPMVTQAPIVYYKFALFDQANFRLEKQANCPTSSACMIQVDGLQPGKKYNFTFEAAASQTGSYAPAFHKGGTIFTLETDSLPKSVAGPQIVFTATGLSLTFTTDKPADSVLSFPIANQPLGATAQRKATTAHVYDIDQALAFLRKDGLIRADLNLILREPNTATEIQRMPLIIGGQFADITSSKQEVGKLRGQKLENAINNYGPAVKALLGLVGF